jgi:hypothetical protein
VFDVADARVNISVVNAVVYWRHCCGAYENPVHVTFEKHAVAQSASEVTSVFGRIVVSTSVAVPPAAPVKSAVTLYGIVKCVESVAVMRFDPFAIPAPTIVTMLPVWNVCVVVVNVATFVAVGIEMEEMEIGTGVAGSFPGVAVYCFVGPSPSM